MEDEIENYLLRVHQEVEGEEARIQELQVVLPASVDEIHLYFSSWGEGEESPGHLAQLVVVHLKL